MCAEENLAERTGPAFGTRAAEEVSNMVRFLAVATLVAVSMPALAEGPEYSFVELGYGRVDLDVANRSVDADAFSLGGSIELGESWQGFLSYGTAEFDFNIDLDEWAIGGGFHGSLSPTSDFVVNVAYLRAEIGTFLGSIDEDGLGVSVGVRNMITPRVELAGFATYSDLGDGDLGFTGRAWYYLTEQFAVGANFGLTDDITRYGIAGRLYFGR
jgi:hypothetical protein